MRISEYGFYWCAEKIKWEDACENISFKTEEWNIIQEPAGIYF